MPGSTFGNLFRVSTFGESHGRAIGCIVDGVPPGLELSEADVQKDLDRRRPGQSKVATPRQESDTVEIVSGVFEGRTMGPPVAMIIRNRNQDSSAYLAIKDKFRPGHADYSYFRKYGLRDWRGSGRASGRETACRVAAGAVARKLLAAEGIAIVAASTQIGTIRAGQWRPATIEENIVRSPDPEVVAPMIAAVEVAREAEDSIGGVIECRVSGLPAGLGEPVFDKLEAMLAHAVMSIGAVKSFEVGAGAAVAAMRGSEYNDELTVADGRVRALSNHAGGIIGGISTGEELVLRCAVRPPASIARPQRTVTTGGEETAIEVHGRHDPCVVPRAVPVVEAMVALALADAWLLRRAFPPAE